MTQAPSTSSTNPAAPEAVQGLWRSALHWAPVWIPALLLVQILMLGLWPALVRRSALDALAPQVDERYQATRTEHDALQMLEQAWKDPMYIARFQRALNQGR
ncbi:hypothetical protein CMO84_03740 [Candidatus Woesearchaeota archaeon]|nr:hypothetical protein [Candidatus Woesearchaeota archaeon]MDP6740543.1 hypothetical protein [Planctomycetota bacterium]MDP6939097.1 hypothetical protein [Planctomycetota bacterium]